VVFEGFGRHDGNRMEVKSMMSDGEGTEVKEHLQST
jgi:hypothetical protein